MLLCSNFVSKYLPTNLFPSQMCEMFIRQQQSHPKSPKDFQRHYACFQRLISGSQTQETKPYHKYFFLLKSENSGEVPLFTCTFIFMLHIYIFLDSVSVEGLMPAQE